MNCYHRRQLQAIEDEQVASPLPSGMKLHNEILFHELETYLKTEFGGDDDVPSTAD